MSETPREGDDEPLEEVNDQLGEIETAISSDYKVLGEKEAIDGTGILGHNTATTGSSYGVEGVTDSADTGAAGVRGEANSTFGTTFGVNGVTNSTQDGAAGVRGVGAATSGGVYGALGLTDSPSGVGIVGAVANSAPLPSFQGFPTGVWGTTEKSSADPNVQSGYGVYGGATATSGVTYGVTGSTESPDGFGVYGTARSAGGYAVYADGDSKTDGIQEVTGDVQTGGDFTYSSIKSAKTRIQPAEFAISDGANEDEVWEIDAEGYGRIAGGSGTLDVNLQAPVRLPDGVTVTAFTVIFYDNVSPGELSFTFDLLRLDTFDNALGTDTMASVSISGSTTQGSEQREQDSTVSAATVENHTYAYYVHGTFTTTVASNYLRFYGCEIEYDYETTGP